MKKRILTMGAVLGIAGGALIAGGTASAGKPTCNWGQLTAQAVAGGFDQGGHSSDPSGDGHGPGTLDEPRAGLGNVVNDGDLNATCELIKSLLP